MKKRLLLITTPITLLLPATLISCGSTSDADRINNAKKKVANVVAGKIRPTLSNPVNKEILLINYLNPSEYDLPKTVTTGIKITLENIEIPLVNANDLIIWFKVESTETLDIAPEISDYYSVNFSEIDGVEGKIIIPPSSNEDIEILKTRFETLVNSNINNFRKLVSDAIYGKGNFDGQSKINVSELINSSQDLMDRLTTDNINRYIFSGKQKNIYLEFNEVIVNDEESSQINFMFTLGNDANKLTTSITLEIEVVN
ncbi:MAG: hypothetical protein KFW07_03230 [Mycoplasmataceae bacterium]|nr:hypothetical protein [Mycoplasmataceae bacterium]